MVIDSAEISDKGEYSVEIDDVSSSATLTVKGTALLGKILRETIFQLLWNLEQQFIKDSTWDDRNFSFILFSKEIICHVLQNQEKCQLLSNTVIYKYEIQLEQL